MKARLRIAQMILLMGDAFLVLASVTGALVLRLGTYWNQFTTILDPFRVFTGASTITVLVVTATIYIAELYSISKQRSRLSLIARLVLAILVSTLLLSVIFYWLPPYRMFRLAQIYSTTFMLVSLMLWRIMFAAFIFPKLPQQRALIVGAGEKGKMLLSSIAGSTNAGFEPVGFIDDDGEKIGILVEGLPVMGASVDIVRVAADHQVDIIIVATGTGMKRELIDSLMRCKISGYRIVDFAMIYKEITGRVPILNVDNEWFVFGPNFNLVENVWTRRIQRLFDVSVACLGLVTSFPIMVFVAVLIKLSSPGKAIYQQERVGLNGMIYTLYKFRTMVADAEKASGPIWSKPGDARVTLLGRVLRRTRIDELPQLWNVLLGDMSFIGPRPERPEFVKNLSKSIPYYSLRLLVKPGLTGWAQVNHGYGMSEEDAIIKLQYDLYYLQEMTLFLNFQIMARTIQTVLFHGGS